MIIVEAAKSPIKMKRDISKYNGISFINNEANVSEDVIKKAFSKNIIDDFKKKADKVIEDRYKEYAKYWIGDVPSLEDVKKAANNMSARIDYNGKDKDHYILALNLDGANDTFFNNRGSVVGYYILNKDGSLNKFDEIYFDGSD